MRIILKKRPLRRKGTFRLGFRSGSSYYSIMIKFKSLLLLSILFSLIDEDVNGMMVEIHEAIPFNNKEERVKWGA